MLLAANMRNVEQVASSASPGRGAAATPHPARDHHMAIGLLGAPVGGFQTRTIEERKQDVLLSPEVIGEGAVLGRAPRLGEQPIHARFQQTASPYQRLLCRFGLLRQPCERPAQPNPTYPRFLSLFEPFVRLAVGRAHCSFTAAARRIARDPNCEAVLSSASKLRHACRRLRGLPQARPSST